MVYLAIALWLFGVDGQGDRLQGWLNRNPERLQVSWERGRSWFPGWVQLTGFELSVDSRSVQFWLRIERASTRVDLMALGRRRLELSEIRAEGTELRLRQRRDRQDVEWAHAGSEPAGPATPVELRELEAMALSRGLAPIPGRLLFSEPPQAGQKKLPPWSIVLDLREATEWSRVWFDREQLQGRIRVDGGAEIRLRRSYFELWPTTVEIDDGQWLRPSERATETGGSVSSPATDPQDAASREPEFDRAADGLHLRLEAGFDGFVPRDHRGRDALDFLWASVGLGADVRSLRFLAPFMETVPALGARASGSFDLQARVRDGIVQSGSRWEFEDGTFHLDMFDLEARGRGHAVVEVTDEEPAVRARVQIPSVTVSEAAAGSLSAGDGGAAEVASVGATPSPDDGGQQPASEGGARSPEESTAAENNGLDLTLQSSELSLARPLEQVDLELDVGPARIEGAGWLLTQLHLPLQVRPAPASEESTGTFRGFLRYSTADRDGEAEIEVAFDDLDFEQPSIGGALAMTSRLDGLDLEGRRAGAVQATLRFDGASDEAPWHVDFDVRDACLAFAADEPVSEDDGPRLVGHGTATVRLSDLSPILGIGAVPKPVQWADRLFDFRGLEGRAALQTDGGGWTLSDLRLTEQPTERIGVRADLHLGAGTMEGAALLNWRDLDATLLLGAERDWVFTDSERVFEAESNAFRESLISAVELCEPVR